jgi:hypothetical protein
MQNEKSWLCYTKQKYCIRGQLRYQSLAPKSSYHRIPTDMKVAILAVQVMIGRPLTERQNNGLHSLSRRAPVGKVIVFSHAGHAFCEHIVVFVTQTTQSIARA